MKKTKFNFKLIIAILVLIVAIILITIFATKANKTSNNEKAENSTLKFEQVRDDILLSEIEVVYKNKKVNDVIVTLIYDDKDIAGEIASIYKDEGEYLDVKQEGSKVVMHYSEKDISEVSNFSKKEIIERFEKQGYVYQK